jgi:hypothetical protein
MTLFEDITAPIIFNGGKNIYALGLCLREGKIHKVKIYNKIYDHSYIYYDYLSIFGGDECLKYYLTTKEWKKIYPGFSGFSTCVEFYYDINRNPVFSYAFGFKDSNEGVSSFKAYYLNEYHEVIGNEIYDYVLSNTLQLPPNKMQTDYMEVKRLQPSSYCYCPKIGHSNRSEIEHNVKYSISEKNRAIFDAIKNSNKNYFILNYGINIDYEKIYLVSEENKNIDNLFELLKNISHLIENFPLDNGGDIV